MKRIRQVLKAHFVPEFLGRIGLGCDGSDKFEMDLNLSGLILYRPLTAQVMNDIVHKKICAVSSYENAVMKVRFTDKVAALIVKRLSEDGMEGLMYGARFAEQYINAVVKKAFSCGKIGESCLISVKDGHLTAAVTRNGIEQHPVIIS